MPNLGLLAGQYKEIYQPGVDLINERLRALPGSFAAEEKGLEQQKVNKFREIGEQSQQKGLFYSGYRPHFQTKFVGEEYLPKVAALRNKQTEKRFGLLEALNNIVSQRGKESIERYYDMLEHEQNLASRERLGEREIAAILEAARIG